MTLSDKQKENIVWKPKLKRCLDKLEIPDDKQGLIFATVANLIEDAENITHKLYDQ